MLKKKAGAVPPKLTEAQQDLVWHLEHGCQIETDSLGGDPVLRQLKKMKWCAPHQLIAIR